MTLTPDTLDATAARLDRWYGTKPGDGGTSDQLRAGAQAMRDADWWHELAWRLRSYTVHDDNCSFNRPPRYAVCMCSLRSGAVG